MDFELDVRRQPERIWSPTGLPAEWPHVSAVVPVNREREVDGVNVTTTHYYLSSHNGSAIWVGVSPAACRSRTTAISRA